jgi:hypothetical protein
LAIDCQLKIDYHRSEKIDGNQFFFNQSIANQKSVIIDF